MFPRTDLHTEFWLVPIHTYLSITMSFNNTTLIPVFYIRNAVCFDKVPMFRTGAFLVPEFYYILFYINKPIAQTKGL